MKDILTKLKTEIKEGMEEIKGVHVLADPDVLPPTVQFPCVGLKDGDVSRSEGMNETVDRTEIVLIYIYVQLLRDEASIMGLGTSKGLLDLFEDLHTELNHNTLSLSGVIHAFCSEEFPSEMFMAGENVFVQRKGCRYVYDIQV